MRLLAARLASLLSACTILQPQARSAGSDKIVLTFDDGPNPEMSPRLLEILRHHQVPATFCYIGCNVDRSPAIVRQAWNDGHALANHTYRHSTADLLSRFAFEHELDRTDRAIANAIGKPGFKTTLVRPPFGLVTPAVNAAARRAEKQLAYLTFYVNESGASSSSAAQAYERIKQRLLLHRGGAIVLHEMRFTKPGAANGPDKFWMPDAVEDLIVWARQHDLEFALYPSNGHDFRQSPPP